MSEYRNNPASNSDAMIRLTDVTKRYGETVVVQPLTMEIQRGEFVVLVGPSGCGKTTTLRMINRLVEPSDGEVWIDGRDVTNADPDELRRQIGYVIQQVGLMPHMSIAANVALVPTMLGWSKEQISERVDELLSLVGLDPASYRSRYPKQLSGGEQQRVGVARALSADPPVMLMDEPFGAIDPITRDHLQDEFLQLQKRIRKTIVFVTHDIDEALRLGDRIAIFADGSRLAQFASPLEILTNPADDFVRSFIGEGAAIRRLSLIRVGDLAETTARTTNDSEIEVDPHATIAEALEQMLVHQVDRIRIAGGVQMGVQDMLLAATQAKQGAAR